MPSNANSTSPGAERSRYFTVRCARSLLRFVFSRRMVWLLFILTSLVVLVYQYENWNGARELAAARQRMLARAGTDNVMDFLPPEAPEADNFFAIPEIVSWREPGHPQAAGGFATKFPADKLFPAEFGEPPQILEEPGCYRLDLEGWAKSRPAGATIPGDQSAAAALLAALGDGNGIIPRLAEGLSRASAQVIPCRRRMMENSGGDPFRASIAAASNCFGFQRNLGIHLRAAALAGDARRATEVAGIMLRLGDAFAGEPTLVGGLVGLALHGVTLEAMNEVLGGASLDDGQLLRLQNWLSATQDVTAMERTFLTQLVETDAVFRSFKSPRTEQEDRIRSVRDEDQRVRLEILWRWGPSGWLDTNRACASDWMLAHCGQAGEEVWRSGADGANRVAAEVGPASIGCQFGSFVIPNPRRLLSCVAIPALSNLWHSSVQNLFLRRCAILTCALHRHRLAHGTFPDSLAALDAAFLPAPQQDPARSGAAVNYRRTGQGFLLWSVGDDRNDDSGDAEKDWIWRHDCGPRTI